MSTPKKKPTTTISLLAGCISGGIEATCVWPMEFMKTQLQLQSSKGTPKFTGVFSGILYTVRTTGFFSLYRGLAPTLIAAFPKAGIRFGVNQQFKTMMMDEHGKLTPAKNFLAGAGAGVVEATFVVTPIETVKTKLIELNRPFIQGCKEIIAKEGIGGVYQGLTATIIKQASNQGLRFMFFNEYKSYMTKDGTIGLSPFWSFIGGMGAGCFSTLGNNPFDVVKTRMQGSQAHLYSSTMDCFVKILKQEGLAAFWKGLIPRLGRVVPGQGIIFMSHEKISSLLMTYMS